MKKKIFGLGIFLLSFMGMATAQYCPTPVRGNNVGNTLGFGTASPYFNSLGARLAREWNDRDKRDLG